MQMSQFHIILAKLSLNSMFSTMINNYLCQYLEWLECYAILTPFKRAVFFLNNLIFIYLFARLLSFLKDPFFVRPTKSIREEF